MWLLWGMWEEGYYVYECGERNIMGCGGGVFTSLGSRMVSFSVDLDLSM